jgi:hypothetical protein
MTDNFYERITTLWKRIKSSKSGTVKLKDLDKETVKEAFNKAWYHEDLLNTSHELKELQDRWDRANKLFHDKDKDGFDYGNALRKAVEILGIDERATKKGKRNRLHPSKDRALMRDYQAHLVFDYIPVDNPADLVDPAYLKDPISSKDLAKLLDSADSKKEKAIKRLYKKYGFSTAERMSRYLREDLGFTKVPSMRSHSKKVKKTSPKKTSNPPKKLK